MKKAMLALIGIAMILSLAGCSMPTDTQSQVSDSDLSSDLQETSTMPEGNPVYDDMFKGINKYTEAQMSYEQVMEMLETGKEHGEIPDSFFLVETEKALSLEECAELEGWNEEYSDRTIYKVKVLKDLISGEEINRSEYIFVSMGNIEYQDSGDPIYAPGEKFTVVLTKPQEGCDFLRTPGSFMFRYDVVEDNTGNLILLSRNSPIDELNLDTSKAVNENVVTSTTMNPAVYTQSVELSALVDFLKTDWQERNISVHYENESSVSQN